jgi:glucose/arabinose dehydrogenase
VTTAIEFGGTYYFTVGGDGRPGLASVYSVRPGQKPVLLADLGAYEAANNTDGDVDIEGKPEVITNPYDLVTDGAGGLYVSASAANAILHISAAGKISPYAIFPNRPNPLFPALGGPTMDQVPTGIEIGPDGALYVATLTGFPFPNGAALVYRLTDSNNDGDALDVGELTVYASGLTGATNLAFDRDGSLLVTEFSLDFLNQGPGRLVRVRGGAIAEVVAAPLISPTGVAVMKDGAIIVTQEFLGIVSEVNAAAAIASQPAPVAGGGITPPNAGDGGLAEDSVAPGAGYAALAAASLAAVSWLKWSGRRTES